MTAVSPIPVSAASTSLTIVETPVIPDARRTGSTVDATRWDAFVAGHPDGTAFHRLGWLRAVAGTLGHRVWALEARDGAGATRGVLPLAQVRSRLFGNYLVAVPFASYGGPLGDADAAQALAAHAVALTRARGGQLLELRCRRGLTSDLHDFAISARKVTVTLPLDGGAEAVFGRFPSKLRSQVRRSERDGVVVRVAPHQVVPFHAVYSEHMRDLGTPGLPRAFFASLAEQFGDDLLFAIATLDGTPIACGAGFRYGDEFEITWASALRSHSRIAPNMALYWRLMAHLADAGVRTFNFGRCTVDSGTHRFKRQWGGVDEPLPWYQWRTTGAPAATPAPGGRYSLAQSVWTRLPLPVARTVGPWIARLLP